MAAVDPRTPAAPVREPGPPRLGAGVPAALLRYRIIAYVVGLGLIVLVCVGVPLKYLADERAVVAVVGPLHGFLYIVYLLVTLDLAIRARFSLLRTLLVMASGTIPFLSFVAERLTTAHVRGLRQPEQAEIG